MDELKKKTETMLRAVLISSPRGVPLYRLDKEYKSITFEPIPYSKCGFNNLEDFLRSMPKVASIQRDRDGEIVVKGVASEADQHVAKLIAKQKKPKIRKSSARPRKPFSSFSATPNKFHKTNFGPRSQTQNARPNRSQQTPKFVPPRLMKILVDNQAASTASQPVNTTRRNFTDNKPFSRRRRQDMQIHVASSSGRIKQRVLDDQKPRSVTTQSSKRTIKSKGPNFQGMEITLNNKPTSPQSKSAPTTLSASSGVLGPEELERIGKMIEDKPQGLYLTRIPVEYREKFGVELPGDLCEQLLLHPEVVHIEKIHTLYIVYPPKKTETSGKMVTSVKAKETNDAAKQNKEEKTPVAEIYAVKPFTVPDIGSCVQVYLSHVESVSQFYVQYKDCESKIQELQTMLDLDFKDVTDFITKPNPGMYCCAQFSVDNSYYRGKVLQCNNEKATTEIFYVDFGNSEWLPNSRLRHLKKRHAELPQMAVHCSLDGIDNGDPSMTETLKSLTDKEFKMTLIRRQGDVLCVRLTDEEDTDITEKLMKGKKPNVQIKMEEKPAVPRSYDSTATATETDKISSAPAVEQKKPVKPFLRSRSISSDQEKKIPERVLIPNDDFIDILVFNVFSTDNISVMLYGEEYSDKLLALEISMMSYFSESTEDVPSTPKANDVMAFKTNELHSEEQWYRVKVLSVKDGQAQLDFVDYGDTRQAPVIDLKALPDRFLDLPFQAFTVSLNDIPKTKKQQVLDKLKQHILGKPLVAEVIQRSQNKLSVELFDTSTELDININEIMRSLILQDEDLTPSLPKVGQQTNVAVSHISETGAVFVQIPGAGLNRLEELMTDITEHYNSKGTKAAEFVSQPTEGQICCAKCSDGSWYRAIILKLVPERSVKVQCVDYGNTEVLSRTALREPTKANKHVSLLPFQAVECHLHGLDKESWNAEKTEKMNQVLADEVVLEVVKQDTIPLVKLFLTTEEGQQIDILDYILEDDQTKDEGSISGKHQVKHDETEKECSSQEEDQEDATLDLPPPVTLSRSWVDVTVSFIIDPAQFMVQPLELLAPLEKNTYEMTEYYKNNKKESVLISPRIGDLCAVRDKDGQYYRALVKAVLSPKQICVLFIDYGNLDIHTSSDFRVLCDQFKQLPCVAVKGSLSGVQPSENSIEWSDEATRKFEELTQWKMLVASVDGDQYTYHYREEHKIPLTLYDTSSDKDINIADALVEAGLARRTES